MFVAVDEVIVSSVYQFLEYCSTGWPLCGKDLNFSPAI